ncbi:hypothetical protein BDV96DRAFT_610991 [Lophiotrema nucula]|uniref:NAD(P)-binding protein n=1 Tax=Lophiotrema nucula TaxID=690887 RepID=A0A6A5ZF88_9PLEO|nr:hypothetical protein BDV96DRAFT_610991 [Lophiotrema nucula]
MAHPNRLQDARVLIFGGTSGIGFAVASLCLSQGSTVIISGSNQPKADKKASELRSIYPNIPKEKVSGYGLDLADSANIETRLTELFEKITNGGKDKIDHVAYTAGDIGNIPTVPQVTAENAMVSFEVRYIAVLLVAKLLSTGKYMPQSPTSSLTLTGGVNTKKPMPGWTLMAARGGTADGMSKGLAVDLAPIRVNYVEPGAIHTELVQKLEDAHPGVIEKFKGATLTRTVGEPSDCAEAYAWFMRDRFANGTVAATNGGQLLANSGFN